MAWKKSIPAEEGYYWVKAAGELTGKIFKHVVHTYSSCPHQDQPDTVFWDGENFDIKSSSFKEWWDVPIEEPPEK